MWGLNYLKSNFRLNKTHRRKKISFNYVEFSVDNFLLPGVPTPLNPIRTTVFALYSKNLHATHAWNFLTFPNFWLRIPIWIFFLEKFCLHSLTEIFRHPVQFFCFNKKIFLQNLDLDIIKKISLDFWDPNGTPCNQNEEKRKFHIWSVGYQNRVKRLIGVHFWRNIWEILKNEDFGFWHFWKRSNFEAFFRFSTLKTKLFSKSFNGSIYVYIPTNFQKNRRAIYHSSY